MRYDLNLTLDLIAEEMPTVERQAQSLDLAFHRGEDQHAVDFYISYHPILDEAYLLRLRCDRYDEQAPSFQFVNPLDIEQTGQEWWPRMSAISYPRGDQNEVVY